jgi:transcription elongation factor Elf1
MDNKEKCPRCGDTGSVLVNIEKSYGNRAARRRAKKAGLPMEKYLPCPACHPGKLRLGKI